MGLREGSSNCNGGWGGPSKHQLGPDPHLGAPKGVAALTLLWHALLDALLRLADEKVGSMSEGSGESPVGVSSRGAETARRR